ncbi:MAG TPA: glycosyltransferase family 1 protein [Candidatus Omnitrophica bacterium]|nr:MAG: hypothetical protein DRP61_01560 [Candidatus Omnitrophota bacterium]RKY45042.1 MAG: hypothetical protein DRP80_00375 [Candidatus Omnitrophota bacterium]HEC70006.1 glycosyltransferase family 1 protein [Candidatus Omnitrophota bacterium]
MNILILTSHLNIGGIPRYVINLAKYLKRRGERVLVGASPGVWQSKLIQESIEVISLPLNTKSILSFKIRESFKILNKFLEAEKIDIIHANTRVTQFLGFRLFKARKVPYISAFHGCYRPHIFRRLLKCEGVKTIAVSNYVKEHLIKKLKIAEEKIRVIYNGIEIIKGYQDEDTERRINRLKEKIKAYPLLGTVSRLTPEKNIASLIKMMPFILKKFPLAKLVILGRGRQEPDLKELVKKLALGEKVLFFKNIGPLVLFKILDVFISLSKGEPFGFSVVEAQSAGVVTLVSNSGAFPEIIEDKSTGIILKEGTPQEVVEALKLVLENPQFKQRLIENAQRKINDFFTIEIMGKNTYNLYKEVLEEK